MRHPILSLLVLTLCSQSFASDAPKLGPLQTEAELRQRRDKESAAIKPIYDEFLNRGIFRTKPETYAVSLQKLTDDGNFVAGLLLGAVYTEGLMGEEPNLDKANAVLAKILEGPHTADERKAIQNQIKRNKEVIDRQEAVEKAK